MQRRIDAQQAGTQHSTQQQQQQQHDLQQQHQPEHLDQQESQPARAPATPTRHEADLVGNISISSDSLPPEGLQPASLLHPSSSSASLSSAGSTPVSRLQLGSIYPAALSDTQLVKLGAITAELSQVSHTSQVGEISNGGQTQPGESVQVLVVPAHALQPAAAAAAASGGKAGQADLHKQHKKSKRERAKGLLSSFTGGYVQCLMATLEMYESLWQAWPPLSQKACLLCILQRPEADLTVVVLHQAASAIRVILSDLQPKSHEYM